jgi:hypothetical protein
MLHKLTVTVRRRSGDRADRHLPKRRVQLTINVVFFRYFSDEGREYLARTWLLDEGRTGGRRKRPPRWQPAFERPDWYVSFGDEPQAATGTRRASTDFLVAEVPGSHGLRGLPVAVGYSCTSPRSDMWELDGRRSRDFGSRRDCGD